MLITVSVLVVNSDVVNGAESEKVAYITFDDGPSKYTSQIIDILDKNDVKGTFFMVNDNMIVFKNVV